MLTHTFSAVILVSFLACAVTTAGIIVIGRYEKWGTNNTAYFMSFAAGVLVSVSFIHIIPKSFEMRSSAPLFLLAGFLTLYLINRFLSAYICQEYECVDRCVGYLTHPP
jgi:zinc and cadmium transporter